MVSPFVIYALPRSRTYWLSKLLSDGLTVCLHDPCVYTHTVQGLVDLLQKPNTGVIDTGLCELWQLMPQVKTAVIRRPIAEVVKSLDKFGFGKSLGVDVVSTLEVRAKCLDQISRC